MNNATVLTLVAFTVERYIAICHPLQAYRFSSVGRALRVLLVIWTVAITCAAPVTIYHTTYSYLQYPEEAGSALAGNPIPESLICSFVWDDLPKHWPSFYVDISVLVFFVLPMLLLCFLYIRIGLKLQKKTLSLNGQEQTNAIHHPDASRRDATTKSTIRLLRLF